MKYIVITVLSLYIYIITLLDLPNSLYNMNSMKFKHHNNFHEFIQYMIVLLCLIYTIIPLFSPVTYVNSSNVCICECCSGTSVTSRCSGDWNSTFSIGDCSEC